MTSTKLNEHFSFKLRRLIQELQNKPFYHVNHFVFTVSINEHYLLEKKGILNHMRKIRHNKKETNYSICYVSPFIKRSKNSRHIIIR